MPVPVDGRPAIDVAVGVVLRRNGSVLLGQRVAGKPYAGWWEFPGGKVEQGESIAQALARELHEELGLQVFASHPWVVREFSYPHARVRLHFHRVVAFEGEPQAREGQAFAWKMPDAIDVAPLLPATIPVLRWLRLPDRYLVSTAAQAGVEVFLLRLDRALAAGIRLVLLDESDLPGPRFETLYYDVRERCLQAGARLLVSSAHAPSYRVAAAGVHLLAPDLRRATQRPVAPLVAATCLHAEDLAQAARLGVDLVVVEGMGMLPDPQMPVFADPFDATGAPLSTADWAGTLQRPPAWSGAHGSVLRGG